MAPPAIRRNFYKEKRELHSGRFKPSVMTGLGGGLAGKVARLTGETIEEISRPRDKYSLKEYKDMIESSSHAKACIELKALRARATIGDYTHSDKECESMVRENLENMTGSINDVVHQLSSALPYGFACAEVVWTNRSPGRRFAYGIETINVLDPEQVKFAGKKGAITHVIYNDKRRGRQWIEYSRIIHVTNGIAFSDPYGSPEARRAMPFFKALQLIFSEMAVAGKNNASGMLLAQADSNERVTILGVDGRPYKNPDGTVKTVTGPEALLWQMKGLESSGIIATDTKNRVTPLIIPSGEGFWLNAVTLLSKALYLAFLVPSLIWDEGSGGLGNAGISGSHKSTLDANVSAVVGGIQDQLVEKVARRLISFNIGYKTSWGKWEAQPQDDPTQMATRAQNLMQAISMSIIPNTDLAAVNRLREDLGVSPVTQEDVFRLMEMQQAMAAMAGQGAGGEVDGTPPAQ